MAEISFTRQHTAFIKGIAILLMIWHHASISEFYVAPEPFLRTWGMIHLSMGGKFCVGLFTFIIGYGYACCKNHTFGYSLTHIWKLLKQYWMLCLLIFIPLGALFGGGNLTDFRTIVYNLAGLKFQYNLASWYVLFYVYAMLSIIPLSVAADRKPYPTLISSIMVFGILTYAIPAKENCFFDALNRWCHYTPVLIVGYVAAKQHWIKRIPNLSAYSYLIISLVVLAARCLVGSVKGFVTDTFFAPIFIFAIVAYLNKAEVALWVKTCFERLGKASMYMWFLHAIFYSDYTKSIFQLSPIWFNNPFAAFVLTTFISYLLAELTIAVCERISIMKK